jgi:hypothetical protein
MGSQVGAPSTKRINETGALMGGSHLGLGGRSYVDRKGKAVVAPQILKHIFIE